MTTSSLAFGRRHRRCLSRLLDGLLTSMNARRTSLLQTVRQRDDSTVEFNAADVTRYLLLATINSYLPVLRHAVVAGDLSAKSVYLLLCELAGQLSTFSTQFDPNDVPKFVYEDLRSTYGTIFSALDGLLKATLAKRYVCGFSRVTRRCDASSARFKTTASSSAASSWWAFSHRWPKARSPRCCPGSPSWPASPTSTRCLPRPRRVSSFMQP